MIYPQRNEGPSFNALFSYKNRSSGVVLFSKGLAAELNLAA